MECQAEGLRQQRYQDGILVTRRGASVAMQSMASPQDGADNNNSYEEQLGIIRDLERKLERKIKECEYHKDGKRRAFNQLEDCWAENFALKKDKELADKLLKDCQNEKTVLKELTAKLLKDLRNEKLCS